MNAVRANESGAAASITANMAKERFDYVAPIMSWEPETDIMKALGNTLIFSGESWDNVTGKSQYGLWASNGTKEGTILLIENFYPSYGNFGAGLSKNALYVAGYDDIYGGLWKTDGTKEGTVFLKRGDFWGVVEDTSSFYENDNIYVFGSDIEGYAYGWWKTDGTAEGTLFVKPMEFDPAYDVAKIVNGYLVFTGWDMGTDKYGLWRCDGTADGTIMLKDFVYPADMAYFQSTMMGGNLYFAGMDDLIGWTSGLWRTDGTPEGTYLVANGCWIDKMYPVGNTLYLFAWDDWTGMPTLYKTDGTADGFSKVWPGDLGLYDPYFSICTDANGKLIFDGMGSSDGQGYTGYFEGLWASDGTAVGTKGIKPWLYSQAYSSQSSVSLDNCAYFGAYDDWNYQAGLFKSDASAFGTELITSSGYDNGWDIGNVIAGKNKVFFFGADWWWGNEGLYVYTPAEQEADLTIASSPDLGGRLEPEAGTYRVFKNKAYGITAIANPGYKFINWSCSSTATLNDAYSTYTTVTLTGDALVMANFYEIPDTATLTMLAEPAEGGTVKADSANPVKTQLPINITATPTEGYEFIEWKVSIAQNAKLADAKKATTQLTVYGDVTVTAVFELKQYIIVTKPTAGDFWFKGTAYEITWLSKGLEGNVKIDLYQNKSLVKTISDSAENTGSYPWTIPADITSGAGFYVQITSIGSPSVIGTSLGTFKIANEDEKYIKLVSPVGGEIFKKGNVAKIKWDYFNITGNVKIELFKAGINPTTIVESTDLAAQEYEWTISPNQASGLDYTIKISSVDSPKAFSVSGYFSIGSSDKSVYLTVLEPSANANYGKTIPATGVYSVAVNQPIELVALANPGYKFLCWTFKGEGTLLNPKSETASVILLGDAEVQACFSVLEEEIFKDAKITISINDSKQNNDKAVITKALIPKGIKVAKDSKVTVSVDSYKLGPLANGEEKKNKVIFSGTIGTDGKYAAIFDMDKKVWNFVMSKVNLREFIDNFDGVSIYVEVKSADESSTDNFGDVIEMGETTAWKFDSKKNGKAETLDISDWDGFEINNASGKTASNKENSDSFSVSKALGDKIEFNKDAEFIIAIDSYELNLENLTSKKGWEQKDNKYTFKGSRKDGKDEFDKLSLVLDFDKGVWGFKLDKTSFYQDIDATDGIDVMLIVGGTIGAQNLPAVQTRQLKWPNK